MKRKKIVIVSNYFPPEMGAASNRIKNMAVNLLNNGFDVTVICPLPNYPHGEIFENYKNRFSHFEVLDGIKVKRYWIYPSTSKKAFKRLISMLSFSFSIWYSIIYLIKNRPNLFIIQSPPLFVALSSLFISKLLQVKSILNVSDLWPLSAFELGVLKKGKMYWFLEKIERLNYKLSNKILTQSKESKTYIKELGFKKEILVYRNVPKLNTSFELKIREGDNLKIVYAGLLGYAQGILEICKNIDFKALKAEFHIYGAGMEELDLIDYLKTNNQLNIFFHGSVSGDKIKNELKKYDIALVSLTTSIYGAVPSKIFEIIALGMPILYKGLGEGEAIINSYQLGLCSGPEDFKKLNQNIIKFQTLTIEKYSEYSLNCFTTHKNYYNLEGETIKLLNFINDY